MHSGSMSIRRSAAELRRASADLTPMGRYSVTRKRKDLEREIAARLRVSIRQRGLRALQRGADPGGARDRPEPRRATCPPAPLGPGSPLERAAGGRPDNDQRPRRDLNEKPAYRDLVARGSRRCLVLADGFYEWLRSEDPRQPRRPLRFSLAAGGSFCFAGLWTRWRGEAEAEVASCTIVTTTANDWSSRCTTACRSSSPARRSWEAWLDPALDGGRGRATARAVARRRADRRAGQSGPELVGARGPGLPGGARGVAALPLPAPAHWPRRVDLMRFGRWRFGPDMVSMGRR